MKRPSFQWYPADWRNNAKLRRCGWAARGVWVDILGLLHDSDEYGVLRWPLKEIIQAVGCPAPLVRELVEKQVFKGCEHGAFDGYVYRPRSGRKEGEPVILIAECQGPIWYSSRLVRDEYVRTVRGTTTRFDEAPKDSPKGGLGEGSKPPKSDGSTSSSPPTVKTSVPSERAPGAPPDSADVIFATGVPLLTAAGVTDRNARSMLGLMRKQHGDAAVIDALQRAADEKPLQPVAWLQGALKANGVPRQPTSREAVRAGGAAAMFDALNVPQTLDIGSQH